jgi:hypothetical protein
MRIGYWWETQSERDHYEDEDVGGWRNIKMDRDSLGRCRLDWSSSGQGQVEGSCECGYETSGSIKC